MCECVCVCAELQLLLVEQIVGEYIDHNGGHSIASRVLKDGATSSILTNHKLCKRTTHTLRAAYHYTVTFARVYDHIPLQDTQ